MFDEESKQILANSVAFWNGTEKVLKEAEQLRGELVVPAVSELRYAGRKLVDFTQSRLANEDMAESKKHIYDYEQCCIRARHDAVDSAVMYMKIYYVHMVKTFGIDAIASCYRHHAELRKAISIVEERVLLSREDRQKRVDLYSEINDGTLSDLIGKFQELVDSEDVVAGIRQARDREHKIAIAGVAIGIVGVLVAIAFGVVTLF
ncbi:MAG: hypothetical protein GC203_05320 [Phenylobacterium sp.]|uniref:hypothetical protein n=1 Tax=Phenylobacterium sp. TaxID=1871053 RepID=UPI0025EE78A9|nr:hypothetical protein [Phenylobacterium sp.]MBI1197264.1 hypothetical protein [Phenylobacterium sp.]